MNIFKILSSNDGTLKEPNVSSFLAYLLDPNEDHGLGDSLLKSILSDFESLKDKDLKDRKILLTEAPFNPTDNKKRINN